MQRKLPYKISTLAGVAIVMANMVGTGAFTSLGFQLKDMDHPLSILTLWILGGILSLAGAISYAEVGTYIRKSGGEYAFLSEMYHPIAGYLSGWISVTVGFAAPIALAAIAFTEYFSFGDYNTQWIAISVIAVITLIHTKNMKTSAEFQISSTLFKVLIMVVMILSGTMIGGQSDVSYEINRHYFSEIKSGAFAIALIYVSYSYSGWNAAAYISEDFENPRKSLPVALIGGTLLVTILYTLLQFVFLKHIPLAELAGNLDVGEIAAKKMFGADFGQLFGMIIAFLLVSSISAMVWVGPRVTASMAVEHNLWQYFKAEKKEVPERAFWLQFLLSAILIVTGTFEQIMIYCGVLLSVSTMLVVLAVFLIRFKARNKSNNAYRSPFFPFFQVLYLSGSLWMIGYTIIHHPLETIIGFLNLVLGLATYYWSSRLKADPSF
ncbi:APC family permease [Chryseobacterium kwangjuense]|uniref:Amino acid permease n=1 Tax=Chryseobacterium kwangjuense TaxID=267125 RepID=A0A135WJA4_9FLAO|nr:amino acid permease [Chryseobacterium kwangjuense]KXH84973.1 amino acid permease [Chryseobacterium kwangjuense]